MRSKIVFMSLVLQSFLFWVMISCTKYDTHYPSNNTNATTNNNTDTTMNDAAKNISWLALGDSYTIGQSVNEDERYPAQTTGLLKSDTINVQTLRYIATTGWTTLNLLDAIAAQNPQGPFDIVTLLIGVNDQYQHFDTGSYRKNFTSCLQQAIALSGNKTDHVFVLSIPDYSVTPFAAGSDTAEISKALDEFNAINKAITLSYNISYTDITPLTREAKYDASLIANDGLHPSGKEYEKWAALLAPEIEKALK
jgi:lysophospholipase L1-like esterase